MILGPLMLYKGLTSFMAFDRSVFIKGWATWQYWPMRTRHWLKLTNCSRENVKSRCSRCHPFLTPIGWIWQVAHSSVFDHDIARWDIVWPEWPGTRSWPEPDQVFTVSTLSTVTPTLCTGNIHQNKGILLHNKHKQIIEGTQIQI